MYGHECQCQEHVCEEFVSCTPRTCDEPHLCSDCRLICLAPSPVSESPEVK